MLCPVMLLMKRAKEALRLLDVKVHQCCAVLPPSDVTILVKLRSQSRQRRPLTPTTPATDTSNTGNTSPSLLQLLQAQPVFHLPVSSSFISFYFHLFGLITVFNFSGNLLSTLVSTFTYKSIDRCFVWGFYFNWLRSLIDWLG